MLCSYIPLLELHVCALSQLLVLSLGVAVHQPLPHPLAIVLSCCAAPAVQRLGVSPHSLAQLVSETFNEMIFIHGDVHCDPHAANMVSEHGA